MDNIKIAQEWFNIAKMDLSSAVYLQDMHPAPLEIICYHCQQSSEKFLKGFLSLKKHEIQKTHDLTLLNKLCQKYSEDFAELEEECIRLTDFGVVLRYPYPMDLNLSDVKLAIQDAEKIKDFVLHKVEIIVSKKDSE